MIQLPQTKTPSDRVLIHEPLRWLFVAYFKDRSVIAQDQEDKCYTRPDGTGSTFTDVLARENELVAFELRHVNENESVIVDLLSGSFMVNGTPLAIHDQYFEPEQHHLELVYFRETRVEIERTVTTSKVLKQYANRYFIGWQTTDSGKQKQVTLAVG